MSRPDPESAAFFRDLRRTLRTGCIFEPRVCTKAAPDMGARRHAGVVKVDKVERPEGEFIQYRCRDCGAVWEVQM